MATAGLQEWNAFLKNFLEEKGYVPNAQRKAQGQTPNPKGTRQALVAEASAAYHAQPGKSPKSPKRTGSPSSLAKASTKKTATTASQAKQFASYCRAHGDIDSCNALKPACHWQGGKLNRCVKGPAITQTYLFISS